MKRNMLWLLLLPILLLGVAATSSCRSSYGYISKVGMIWNTTYHIKYRGPESLSDSILVALNKVGASVNAFDSLSTLSRINANLTDSADAFLMQVADCARKVYEHTNGAFDPTLGPVIRAWGFGKGHEATSDTAKLDSLRAFTGFDKWMLDGVKVKKSDPRVELNLSGIAKGFGCDMVAEMFLRNGVTDFMIEIGGEIRMGGKGEQGEMRGDKNGKWTIAIDKPVVSDSVIHDFLATVDLTDCGLATSGDYRNFHTDSSGNRFGHTLDPKTLRPARTDVLSVTVVAPTAMEADAYATACMVLGSRKSAEMAEKYKLKIVMVKADGVWVSSAMKPLFNADKD